MASVVVRFANFKGEPSNLMSACPNSRMTSPSPWAMTPRFYVAPGVHLLAGCVGVR